MTGLTDMVSLAELARLKGVSKQAIGKRVDRLEAAGALKTRKTRPDPRGGRLVSLAAFDKAAHETTDAVRSANGGRPVPHEAADDDERKPTLAHAQALKVRYQAELARLNFEERAGELVPVADVQDSMIRAADAMIQAIDQLPGQAEACAAAVADAGVAGARKFLRETARAWRARLARELRLVGKGEK